MDFSRVRQLMDEAVLEHGVPCSDIAISYNGECVFRYFNGTADDLRKKPLKGNELYFLYSATKLITCVAAMQLVEQGKLGLGDNLSQYIPEYGRMTVKTQTGLCQAQNPITVKNLFTMTSGIKYALQSEGILSQISKNPNSTTQELVRAMAKEPLAFEPGTGFEYGLSHDVLAAVVEIVSGISFGDYLQKNIFDVCQMSRTGFRADEIIKEQTCSQYRFDAETQCTQLWDKRNEFVLTPNYQSGGAGLISCVDDYSNFVTELANGHKLLRKETIDLMRENHLCGKAYDDVQSMIPGYGYGLGVRTDAAGRYGAEKEFGWDGAAGAYTSVDPDRHIAVFYATHIRSYPQYLHNCIHWQLRDAIHDVFR